jgi:hypothetical protein
MLLTSHQAAQILQVHPNTVCQMARTGRLPSEPLRAGETASGKKHRGFKQADVMALRDELENQRKAQLAAQEARTREAEAKRSARLERQAALGFDPAGDLKLILAELRVQTDLLTRLVAGGVA